MSNQNSYRQNYSKEGYNQYRSDFKMINNKKRYRDEENSYKHNNNANETYQGIKNRGTYDKNFLKGNIPNERFNNNFSNKFYSQKSHDNQGLNKEKKDFKDLKREKSSDRADRRRDSSNSRERNSCERVPNYNGEYPKNQPYRSYDELVNKKSSYEFPQKDYSKDYNQKEYISKDYSNSKDYQKEYIAKDYSSKDTQKDYSNNKVYSQKDYSKEFHQRDNKKFYKDFGNKDHHYNKDFIRDYQEYTPKEFTQKEYSKDYQKDFNKGPRKINTYLNEMNNLSRENSTKEDNSKIKYYTNIPTNNYQISTNNMEKSKENQKEYNNSPPDFEQHQNTNSYSYSYSNNNSNNYTNKVDNNKYSNNYNNKNSYDYKTPFQYSNFIPHHNNYGANLNANNSNYYADEKTQNPSTQLLSTVYNNYVNDQFGKQKSEEKSSQIYSKYIDSEGNSFNSLKFNSSYKENYSAENNKSFNNKDFYQTKQYNSLPEKIEKPVNQTNIAKNDLIVNPIQNQQNLYNLNQYSSNFVSNNNKSYNTHFNQNSNLTNSNNFQNKGGDKFESCFNGNFDQAYPVSNPPHIFNNKHVNYIQPTNNIQVNITLNNQFTTSDFAKDAHNYLSKNVNLKDDSATKKASEAIKQSLFCTKSSEIEPPKDSFKLESSNTLSILVASKNNDNRKNFSKLFKETINETVISRETLRFNSLLKVTEENNLNEEKSTLIDNETITCFPYYYIDEAKLISEERAINERDKRTLKNEIVYSKKKKEVENIEIKKMKESIINLETNKQVNKTKQTELGNILDNILPEFV